MRAKILIFIVAAFLARLAHAENAITFSPALPKPWVELSSKTIPGTNPVTHNPLTANITVLQDTTNLTTMMVSVIPIASPEATNNLAIDARNWVQGVVNGFAENHNVGMTQSVVRTENKKTFAETAFTIQMQDGVLFGISRYSIVKTNAIGWVAFDRSSSIETNKTVLRIVKSVRVRK